MRFLRGIRCQDFPQTPLAHYKFTFLLSRCCITSRRTETDIRRMKMSCVETWKPVAAMLTAQLSLAVVNILFKKALNGGMDRAIIIVYRQTIATIFLIPFAFFLERSSWSTMTARLICQMFLCALLGLTLTQYLFLVGLDYTSATFTCAFINMVPVITFILALPLRMERVHMSSNSGKAKILGTVICVVGTLILSLYKCMVLINPSHGVEEESLVRPKRLGPGAAFLLAGSVAWSSWFLIQSRIGNSFPYQYTSTSIMSFFSSIQSAVLCLITDRNFSKWILEGELQIVAVVFSGIVGSGLCYVVMSWCVKGRGPVFTAAFSPLIQIFAVILDVMVLHEQIYLGSLLGSLVVIVGMYVLLWGKSKDEVGSGDSLPKRIDECHGKDSVLVNDN